MDHANEQGGDDMKSSPSPATGMLSTLVVVAPVIIIIVACFQAATPVHIVNRSLTS
jgi:hypothetical protein